VRADQELQIDLAPLTTVHASALGTLVLGSAPTLLAPPIQDDLDVAVGLEALEQILVEALFALRDEKEMSGHELPHYSIWSAIPEGLESIVTFREAVSAGQPE
jgi:hypothetical protein